VLEAALPPVGGILLLLNESDGRNFERLFVSRLLFGTSLLMKQPAVFFILFGAVYPLPWPRESSKR
jgi:hypothetical protein